MSKRTLAVIALCLVHGLASAAQCSAAAGANAPPAVRQWASQQCAAAQGAAACQRSAHDRKLQGGAKERFLDECLKRVRTRDINTRRR